MAVAALATSAIALTAGPAPTPPANGAVPGATAPGTGAPQDFAQLVIGAKPDGKAAQDGPRAESEADGETEATVATEDGDAHADADKGEKTAEKPTDLLAQIEAMVAAAGQVTVRQPVATPIATPPVTAAAAESSPAGVTAATNGPVFTAPSTAWLMRQPVIVTPPTAAATPGPGEMSADVPAMPTTTADLDPLAPAVAGPAASAVAPSAGPTPPAARDKAVIPTDIAAMIASLKAAFAPAGDDPEPSVAAPMQPAAAADAASIVAGSIAPVAAPAVALAPAGPNTIPLAVVTAPGAAAVPAPASAAVQTVITLASGGNPAPGATSVEPAIAAPLAPAPAPTPAPSAAVAAPTPPPIDSAVFQAIATEMRAAPVKSASRAEAHVVAKADAKIDVTAMPAQAAASAAVAPADMAIPTADALADRAGEPAADPAADAATVAATPALPTAPVPIDPALVTVAGRPVDGIAAASNGIIAAPNQADLSVDRHLDLARGDQWLDRLAHDITQAATQQGHLKFQLNPEHLGALTVEIANSAAGASIKLTAETDQTRTIIADAQPRLIAEVRAQGLRVAESHVDLNQQGSGGQSAFAQGQQRQASENHKPFARTQSVPREDAGNSAPSNDGELYA